MTGTVPAPMSWGMGGAPPWFVPNADQGIAAAVPWTQGLGPVLVASKNAPASCPAAMALAWAASRAWTASLQAALATAAASSARACAAAGIFCCGPQRLDPARMIARSRRRAARWSWLRYLSTVVSNTFWLGCRL